MRILNPGRFTGYIEMQAKLTLVGYSGTHDRTRQFDSVQSIVIAIGDQINWNKVKEVRIDIEVHYRLSSKPAVGALPIRAMMPAIPALTGLYQKHFSWSVSYGENGVLFEPQGTVAIDDGSDPGPQDDVTLMMQFSNISQNTHEVDFGFVSLVVQMVCGHASDGLSFGAYGAGIGGIGKSSSSFSIDIPVKAHLLATERPTINKPILLPDEVLNYTVYFDEPNGPGSPPGEGKAFVSVGEIRMLKEKWIEKLRTGAPELFAAVSEGRIHIQLDGYASTTGKDMGDADLSLKRATAVRETIKHLIRPPQNLIFKLAAHGHRNATQSGAVPQEKRVDISIEKSEAIKAIETMRKRR